MVSLKVPVSVATETNGNGPTTRLRDYATAFCDKESVLVFTNKAGDGQTSQGQKLERSPGLSRKHQVLSM